MQFERRYRDNKQTYMKTKAYKLYSTVFVIFLPNDIKIILIIFIYTLSKLVHFFWHTVYMRDIHAIASDSLSSNVETNETITKIYYVEMQTHLWLG